MSNSEETQRKYNVQNLKPFKPGESGNMKGRPRDPLKQFSLREFQDWTDSQKRKFLKKIKPEERWRMTEGNPKNDDNMNVTGEISISIAESIHSKHANPPSSSTEFSS
jgi:hypothetical protein